MEFLFDRPVILIFEILSIPYIGVIFIGNWLVVVPLSFLFTWVIAYPWIGFELKLWSSYMAYV
jgi:hypothetical protein